jgi:hypothetical protein
MVFQISNGWKTLHQRAQHTSYLFPLYVMDENFPFIFLSLTISFLKARSSFPKLIPCSLHNNCKTHRVHHVNNIIWTHQTKSTHIKNKSCIIKASAMQDVKRVHKIQCQVLYFCFICSPAWWWWWPGFFGHERGEEWATAILVLVALRQGHLPYRVVKTWLGVSWWSNISCMARRYF